MCAREESNLHGILIPLGPQPSASTSSATCACLGCDLAGSRTQDPLLKREMLYQLSYQVKYK